jgi:dTDP-4-amino-4,6-dideoxygalactose transaminase
LAFYRDRFGWGRGLCPVAESIEPRLVTLPLFPTMTEADQDDVLRAIDKVCTYYAR